MLERMWRKGTLLHCWWECELVQPPWKTAWRFLKKLKIAEFHCWGFTPKIQMQWNSATPAPNVYSSNVHNSQTVEGASVSINRWMDKEDVVYVYNGILLSHQKWQIPNFCFGVDGPGGYFAEWNKSIWEGQTLYVLIHLGNIKNSEREYTGRERKCVGNIRKGDRT